MIGREVAKLMVLTKGAEGGGNAPLPQRRMSRQHRVVNGRPANKPLTRGERLAGISE